MPRLSLYRDKKSNDYKFFDRLIKEQFTVGGTDLYVHKYTGVNNVASADLTQPVYDNLDPTNIQDLLFLENRDRKYAPDIYRIRGHYNVQNLDFDLSQFGLFLNNDIIFITIHYNEMIETIGRKLMVGDVLELPHLTDYHPLNEAIPVALRRYYQVTDGNFASEGFSQTWYPHLWRIKCEPLVDSQEFSSILSQPTNKDNYLGDWNNTTLYPAGYSTTFGGKTYIAKIDTPINNPPPDTTYWELDTADNLSDILSRYNTNIKINDAAIAEATRLLPASGYDRSQLYVAPLDDNNKPVSPVNIVYLKGSPTLPTGTVHMVRTPGYKIAAPAVRVSAEAMQSLLDMTVDSDPTAFSGYTKVSLKLGSIAPERLDTGSGQVAPTLALTLESLGSVTGPYGTTDNEYSEADQDPTQAGFTGTLLQDVMDYRADADPRYHFIARFTPRSFGYTQGYLVGDAAAPNGLPMGSGITFPSNPKNGDYFLRTDYLPQQLFRWSGQLWVKISENVRTGTGLGDNDKSQRATFINNSNVTVRTDGTTMPEKQALSQIFKIQAD
jgi:hypothetical protein